MTRTYLIRIRNIILLILVQSLIFNRIHLFGYATAAVYLIFLLKLPRYTSRNELLLWAFIMGITIDLFGNTPGINAAAATLLAFVRNPILESFIQKSNPEDLTPGIRSMRFGGYMSYATICITIFYTALYILELFTIRYPMTLLIGVASSTLLTILFILVTEKFSSK